MRASLLLLAALMLSAAPVRARASALALPALERPEPRIERRGAAEVPPTFLAQRAIVREWGVSDDSVYAEVQVADWKSAPAALLASAVLPGSGQIYVGEGSGWVYLAGEAAGWTIRALSVRRADDREAEYAALLGDPYVDASGWSFERYRNATGGDVTWLQTLWIADRENYYRTLARDPAYLAGFSGEPQATAERYRGVRQSREDALSRARTMEVLLVVYHLVSAWDALRAARFHNLPLSRNLPLQMSTLWRDGSPEWTAALVRRF